MAPAAARPPEPSLDPASRAPALPGAEPWADVGPIEVLEVRSLLEPEAAALAAEHATDADLTELREIVEALLRGVSSDRLHWTEDRRFHEQIARCSGKPIYERLVALLWSQRGSPLYRRFDEIFADQSMVEASQNDHRQIFSAIESRDADWARLCMRRHLDRVRATYMRAL
jgi:GntR family transcriptional repressor for pyruvate dehydrogenase complex